MPSAVRRLGERGVLVLAFAAYALAHLCFATAGAMPVIVVGAIVLGSGFGLSVPLVNVMTVERSAPVERGRKLATLAMAIFLGQFLASFMGLLPQGTIAPFLAAAVLAFVAGMLSMTHPGLRSDMQPPVHSAIRT
jgi:MFS family permease